MDEPVITNSSADATADLTLTARGPRDDIERKGMPCCQEHRADLGID
jgi:hypothetical protein